MKSPKSSHTGDPLTIVLISYPGKDTHPPKTHGNLNETYNMPKQYSRSTNSAENSKDRIVWCEPLCSRATFLCSFQDCVVQTFVFLSCLSCTTTCHPHPTPLLLVQDLLTVNISTVSFLPLSLDDSATFSMPPFFNNHPLSLS